MSSLPPVPSMGALRALRHIALGTTCTVAFGIGFIVEDRRRRISTLRKVYENGQRLKMARGYHSADVTAGSKLEEWMRNDYEYSFPKGHERQEGGDIERTQIPAEAILHGSIDKMKPPAKDLSKLARPELRLHRLTAMSNNHSPISEVDNYKPKSGIDNHKRSGMDNLATSNLLPIEDIRESLLESLAKASERQVQLASNITQVLAEGFDPEACDAATTMFSKAVTEGLEIKEIARPLLVACTLLSRTCEQHGKIKAFIPILQSILSYGPPDEASFYDLNAPAAIASLLGESGFQLENCVVTDIGKLEEAVAIFLTEFREKPSVFPPEMLNLGDKLCKATFQAKLHALANKIYWRVSTYRGDAPLTNVDILILASHAMGYHQLVPGYFTQLFTQTPFRQLQYNRVVHRALDSALKLLRFDEAEKVLYTATEIARKENTTTSTKWLLRVLGDYWRTTRDLAKTQALFGRLETLLEFSNRPQTLYAAMIQCCVESGSEKEAQKYTNRFVAINGCMSVRVYGHFALAKAMKNDWDGVEANFYAMNSIPIDFPCHYADVFTPILKIFAASHSVSQTESFLHLFIEKYRVIPNQYISNIMIGKYCKAGEIESILKWVKYILPLGVRIDSATLNTVLNNLRSKWNISFGELFRICVTVRSHSFLIDDVSIAILRRAAIKQAGGAPEATAKLLSKVESLNSSPKPTNTADILGPMSTSLIQGRPDRTLEIYRRALQTEQTPSPQVIAVAVTACIKFHGRDLEPAIKLIEEARLRELDVRLSVSRLLLYHIQIIEDGREDMEATVKHIITLLTSLSKRGLDISMPLVTQTASTLVARGNAQAAINLWTAASKTSDKHFKCLDIVSLTVLLRAYISISDYTGIRWVVNTVAQKGLCPDRLFKHALKNGRRQARVNLETQPLNHDAQLRYDLLDKSLRVLGALRLQRERQRKEAEMALSVVGSGTKDEPSNDAIGYSANDLQKHSDYASWQQEQMRG